jgi:hypothetical protein
MGVTNLLASRSAWESTPERVIAPYTKATRLPSVILSTTGHANPVGSREVHLPRLNTLGDR